MNWNIRVRQTHRVVAIVFVATVVVTVVTLALQGPAWASYLPLLPLALLLISGLYLYVLPYLSARRTAETGARPPRARATGTRALHRWSAAVFVVSVLVTTVTLALQGPIWVSYLPLLPLLVLLITGLVLFARTTNRRTGRRTDARTPRTVSGPRLLVFRS
ncbi:hypothetical protein [Nocardia carnea]|uniref:hypothetical protein n=1 Tax=Nocardia carnea TaxID=37328 RepID=UPI00245550C7|nr:hypothetical protein [Nocardia carnea]